MEKLTVARAIELLTEVVEGNEDYIYEPPGGPKTYYLYWNIDTNQPSCIVGHVLYRAGVPRGKLTRFDNLGIVGGGIGARALSQELPELLPYQTASLLGSVQSLQDRGTPWGHAVKLGVKTYSQHNPDDDAARKFAKEGDIE